MTNISLYINKDQENTGNDLQLSPINVNQDYLDKWNENCSDFMLLTKGDQPLRETLYRVGGLGDINIKGKDYFMLLKYIEAFYSDSILKSCNSKDPKHLAGVWCIIDKNGVEKIEFKQFEHPYLIKNSLIYTINSNYYNIETGQLYCRSHSSIESCDFLFLDNRFNEDKSKSGVMKINKKDGTYELFK